MIARQQDPLALPGGVDELESVCSLPRALHLRALLLLALAIGAMSAASAVQWPLLGSLIVVVDLAAMSVLLGLAACRRWLLLNGPSEPRIGLRENRRPGFLENYLIKIKSLPRLVTGATRFTTHPPDPIRW